MRASFLTLLLSSTLSYAVINVDKASSSTSLAYAADVSTTDLINSDQVTFSSAQVSTSSAGFSAGGINNGGYANTTTDSTWFQSTTHFPANAATATYFLNTTRHPQGYTISSIRSFIGWYDTNSMAQANQTYTVEVRHVGSPNYTVLTPVSFKPFADISGANGSAAFESKVTITDDSGDLATEVDSIRFTFTDPIGVSNGGVTSGTGANKGTVIREIDVMGRPTFTPGVVVSAVSSTTSLAYVSDRSATDLINSGQSTLASAVVSASNGNFSADGINDGGYSGTLANNTWFQSPAHFPANAATATYFLNTTEHPLGYQIGSIRSFMGWYGTNSMAQANQTYTVEIRHVGSADYTLLTPVSYKPNTDTNGASGSAAFESRVSITDGSGTLATGVDSIRFTFTDPIGVSNGGVASGTGANKGTVIREIDVIGSPVDETVVVSAVSSTTALKYAADVRATDLINNGQSSLSSATVSANYGGVFPGSGINNGGYSNGNYDNTFFQVSPQHFPATATYILNTTVAPQGYQIDSIQSFMGWTGASQAQGNQTYTVEVRSVGSPSYKVLAIVDYKPFSDINGTDESKVALTRPGGPLATGVDGIRFTFANPVGVGGVPNSTGINKGTVVREIDVIGRPMGATVAINQPSSRHIVQRSQANVGAIPISGFYYETADRIEARAVVMAGSNTGATTEWQTIQNTPTGGTYAGILTGVAAGGWYQLEVRSVTGVTPSLVSVLEKVGVGDIYVTCGQSNSANHGGPVFTPTDDRVSTRTSYSAPTWRHGYDPQPLATGTGGSPWSRLGDQLAADEGVPIGFVCVGYGGTEINQWLPGTAYYTTRLKPAIQSLGPAGFRAILWHQGESDAIALTSATVYAARFNSIVAQSRIDAGWLVPWYAAEAVFHPNTDLAKEEPVVAGQRLAVYGDPDIHIGPTTDAFHLETAVGGKLFDSVHFNAAGLLDHATQWKNILRGTTTPAPRNGDFEDNRTAAITGLPALADGAIHVVDTANVNSPSVIGWRVLSADGQQAADGVNGFHNPTVGTFAGAVDSINSGVLPSMNGPHVAMLDGGTAGNFFLHTTRAMLQANSNHTLKIALGVRDNASTFGAAHIEILANGAMVVSADFSKADLDTLRGGDSSGTFTDVTVNYQTAATVTTDQVLAIKIVKTGGAGTVLDFDDVRLTTTLTPYAAWRISKSLPDVSVASTLDADSDGVTDFMEFAIGGNPGNASDHGFQRGALETVEIENALTFTILTRSGAVFSATPDHAMSADKDGISYRVEGSEDLTVWQRQISEILPPSGLDAPPTGYEYHRFRANGSTTAQPTGFVRLRVASGGI